MRMIVARVVELIRKTFVSAQFSSRRLERMVPLLIAGTVFGTPLIAQNPSSQPARFFFPDTETLISHVAEHQKDVEALFSQYTFTDKTTVYMIDKKGAVRSQPPTLTTTHLHRTRFSLCTSATMANRLRRTTLTGKRRRSSASCKMTNVKLKRIQALAPKTPFCSRTSLSNHNSIL